MLRPVLAGERGVGGFKLETAPEHEIPIVIAALRDRMLRLAAEIGDGVFCNFLPLSGVGTWSSTRGAPGRSPAASSASRPPRTRRSAWPMDVRGLRRPAGLRGLLPRAGLGREARPDAQAWKAGERKRALERCPEDLVREIFVFGTPEAMKERLAEFEAGGITSVSLLLVGEPSGATATGRRAGAVSDLVTGEDGRARCWWGASSPEYVALPRRGVGPAGARRRRALRAALPRGVPVRALVADDPAQARELPRRVRRLRDRRRWPRFGDADVERLMADAGIVRNRAKIEAAIANARAAAEGGDLERADLVVRAGPDAPPGAAQLRRRPGGHAGVDGTGQGPEEARLPLRRADDRLRADAGVRDRQRPPRGLPCRDLRAA